MMFMYVQALQLLNLDLVVCFHVSLPDKHMETWDIFAEMVNGSQISIDSFTDKQECYDSWTQLNNKLEKHGLIR